MTNNIQSKEEYVEAFHKLQEVEMMLEEYKSEAERARSETQQYKAKLEEDDVCLKTAVHVASSLYRRNTMLKNSMQKKAPAKTIEMSPEEIGCNDEDDALTELFGEVQLFNDQQNEKIEKLKAKNQHLKSKCRKLEDVLLQVNNDYVKATELNVEADEVMTKQQLEIEEMKEKFELETQVRQRAETYAATMYGKNKAWQRKSDLDRTTNADEKLQKALNEIERLSKELEESKLESKMKIQELQDALDAENGAQIKDLEKEIENLKQENKQLKEKPLCPAPPPPPPPVLMQPPVKTKTIAEQINENRTAKKKSARRISTPNASMPNMANAMDELFKRIKSGNSGLRQTGLITPADDNSKDPYEHIYDDKVKMLKRRLTMSRRYTRRENNAGEINTTSHLRLKLKPVHKSQTLPAGIEKPEFTRTGSKLYKTTSNDAVHPELLKVFEKRKATKTFETPM